MFPKSEATATVGSIVAEGRQGYMMTKTVLIVEDNELNMKLFHDLLDALGYATVQTKDGMEALKLARDHHPDLILMDIQLPEISGLEATRQIKRHEDIADIPVIAITAHALPGDEHRIRAGGCADYVAKPVIIGELVDTVRRHLN